MEQAWLQVAGQVVEFTGVLMLAWEWFAARRQDRAEEALRTAEARREESRTAMQRMQTDNPAMQRHFEMTRDMDKRMTERQLAAERARYGGMRGWAVAVSLLLVSIGFALQLIGTVPGCCTALGIRPGG